MSESSNLDKARYDFKKAMQEIMKCRGRGTELISVYVPESKQIHEVMSYLREEQSQAANIKSKATMKNVTSAIDSISARLKTYKSSPPNGIAIFCGEVPRAGDQTKMVQFTIIPPEPITSFLYRCDSSFFTEPLEEMLEDKTSYGLITIDRREATIGLVSGSRTYTLKHFDSLVPSKHHQGGQSAVRFERLIELAAHEFYKKVADYCTEAFLDRTELKGIIIGGPGATKEFFVKEEYLHHELRKKIVSPLFDTGNTDESGIRELVEKAKDTMEGIKLIEEKKHVQRLLDEIRKADGGLSVYGYEGVRNAAEVGAVEVLLISESLDKRHLTIKCSSGHVNKLIVDNSDEKQQCPDCGQNAEIIEDLDLVDEFFEITEKFSSNMQIISPDSEEGDMLMRAFGGIAAILRYSLS